MILHSWVEISGDKFKDSCFVVLVDALINYFTIIFIVSRPSEFIFRFFHECTNESHCSFKCMVNQTGIPEYHDNNVALLLNVSN